MLSQLRLWRALINEADERPMHIMLGTATLLIGFIDVLFFTAMLPN